VAVAVAESVTVTVAETEAETVAVSVSESNPIPLPIPMRCFAEQRPYPPDRWTEERITKELAPNRPSVNAMGFPVGVLPWISSAQAPTGFALRILGNGAVIAKIGGFMVVTRAKRAQSAGTRDHRN
jgi:hypothetical protein